MEFFNATNMLASYTMGMDKTGTGEMAVQAMNQMLPMIKRMVPDAPEAFWVEFQKELNPNELVEMIIPIYQKHFSQEDIDAVNAFYETKAGKNFIQSQPLIMQESMIVGQAWSQGIVQKIMMKAQTVQPISPQAAISQ